MEELKDKIESIKQILISNTKCSDIVIFGSFALGVQNKDSDVDIAIRTNQDISKKRLLELSNKIEEIVKRDVDLIDLKQIQDGFRYEILINGITIYSEDEINFENYKLDMYREYLELNESRQEIIENIKKGEF